MAGQPGSALVGARGGTWSGRLRVSIGVLAHNEQAGIGAMLASLFAQTIFDDAHCARLGLRSVELVCVPNGCTDGTEAEIRRAFAENAVGSRCRRAVHVCGRAGKAAAWNTFIHEAADPAADYFILADADIEFDGPDVIEKLLLRLERDELAVVATDRPIKAFRKNRASLSLKDRVSLRASEQATTEDAISGQLYCARATELRKIWMPFALPVEDGFLAAMVVTDGFSRPRRSGLVVRVNDAAHYFDSHEDVAGFLRHERRIIVGSVINAWLFQLLWERGASGHVGSFIARENARDPDWVDGYIRQHIASRSWWKIPRPFLWKRFSALRGQPLRARLMQAPIALLGTALTLVVCVQANATLKQAQASRFW